MLIKRTCTTFTLTIGIGALLAFPAMANSGGEARSKDKSADDSSRRICRSLTPTGTRFPVRVCKTKADWDLEMRQTQDSALAHQYRNSGASESSGPR
jgi:hypothetical protein